MRSRHVLCAALLVTSSGCDAAIAPAPTTPVPVIQSLLVAGDTVQTAWVEWRTPADSSFGPDVRPVAPALVQLVLVLPGGTRVPFNPAPATPGRFDAAAIVNAGGAYALEGSVAGLTLSAATTVPNALAISVPAQDTVRIPRGSCLAFCALPYHWAAGGAGAYLYVQSRVSSGQFTQTGATRDTIGIVHVLQTSGAPDTAQLTVFALEPHAAAFLLPTTPRTSITGVFGLFGAASRSSRWIVWE